MSRFARNGLLLVAAVLLLRLAFTAWFTSTHDLVPDEAYYWDWSRGERLDYGYYSKPPMVAWLIAGSTTLFGANDFAVKLPAVLLGTAGLLGIALAARRAFGDNAGWLALLLFLLTPGSALLSLLMTIDAPLLSFWGFALWATLGALLPREGEDARPRWWLAGLFTGLALLSKQTAAALPALTALAILLRFGPRRLPWGGVVRYSVPIVLSLLPVLLWNAQHGWVTLVHTSEHFGGEPWNFPDALGDFAGFFGSQAVLFAPVTFLLVLAVIGQGLRRWRALEPAERVLWLFGPLPLAGVMLLALAQRVQPNWAAPFYLAAVALAAGWLARGRFRPAWRKAALWTGAMLTLLAYALPPLLLATGLAGVKQDPLARARGWEALAHAVDEVSVNTGLSGAPILCITHRQPVSELAFYLPSQPIVYRWNPSGRIESQHEVWPGPTEHLGENFLLVSSKGEDGLPAEVRDVFRRVDFLEKLEVPYGPDRSHRYHLYAGRSLRSWPPALTPDD